MASPLFSPLGPCPVQVASLDCDVADMAVDFWQALAGFCRSHQAWMPILSLPHTFLGNRTGLAKTSSQHQSDHCDVMAWFACSNVG